MKALGKKYMTRLRKEHHVPLTHCTRSLPLKQPSEVSKQGTAPSEACQTNNWLIMPGTCEKSKIAIKCVVCNHQTRYNTPKTRRSPQRLNACDPTRICFRHGDSPPSLPIAQSCANPPHPCNFNQNKIEQTLGFRCASVIYENMKKKVNGACSFSIGHFF